MARLHGKSAQFSYNGVALQSWLDSIDQSATAPEGEITSFADVGQNFVSGKKDVKTELAGSLDLALSGVDATLFGGIGAGPKSTIFDPSGSGPGANDPEYQCTASGLTGVLVASYRLECPVGGAARFSATLQHSGATSRAVA